MTAGSSSLPPPRLTLDDMRGAPQRRRRELTVRILFLAAAATAILISILIILALVGRAGSFIFQVDLGSLIERGWFPRRDLYGLPTIIAGTLVVAVIGMLVATPLGLGAAIYLSEYASPRLRRTLKPILEVLAGIPSVVLGYFAITVISPGLVQNTCPGGAQVFNMASAGIAVGILITPLISSVAEDALYAVPRSLREASYGLGARKRTTSLRIVFPAAVSGIVAALILGFSRAIGETMIVAITAGASGGSLFQLNPCETGQTMTAAMTALAIGSEQVRGADLAFPSLFFVGLLLFVMTLALNLAADAYVRRVRRQI
jgi:phosphate transport system permease protein